MRLSKIKLAGFKSFVDPTTIQFLSNLVAVAGPNGCGKSNVIDAVRWVMGESSAKHLRGGALTDVIFSGSASRKPVGQATVELLFDNAEGKLGGEYASYSEIAIKRQVTRDGQSIYFLNGQRCRRKDVTDIFLGTGLGPRSYAIIEQGMISRVIDAKPDDLRIFLEEAAGISKYKERRRETENRIGHTQTNLARLNDIRDELDHQLKHLHRQSEAAQKYTALKAQEREMSAQLAAMAYLRLQQEIKTHETTIRTTTTELEEQQSHAQRFKTEQEKERLHHTEMLDALNAVQKDFYSVGGEIGKIEQAIAHHIEREQQLLQDKEEAHATLVSAQMQLANDSAQIQNVESLVNEITPEYEAAFESEQQQTEIQQNAEMELETWREKTAELQKALAAPTQLAETEKAKIVQLERQIHQTKERCARLEGDIQQLQQTNEAVEIAVFDEKIEAAGLLAEKVLTHLEQGIAQKDNILQTLQSLRPQVKTLQHNLNEMRGQQIALQALQASAFGKDAELKKSWLSERGLEDAHYMAQKIEVSDGFENALEMVLGGFLESLGMNGSQWNTVLQEGSEIGISAFTWRENQTQVSDKKRLGALVKNVGCLPESIYQTLMQVYAVATWEEALAVLPTLSGMESVITKDGRWLGQGWLKVKSKDTVDGLLVREEKLKKLEEEISLLEEKLAQIQNSIEENEENLKTIELARESQQQEKNRLQQEIITLQSERKIKQNRIEQNEKRLQQVQQEFVHCRELMNSALQEVNVARNNVHHALEAMAQFTQEQEAHLLRKTHLQEEVSNARLKAKEAQQKAHQLALTLQSHRTQLQSLNENVSRGRERIENAQARMTHLLQILEKNESPVAELKLDLEAHLEKRIILEHSLNEARDNVTQAENQLRSLLQALDQCEKRITTLREQLETTKMAWQAILIRQETALEKLNNTDFTLESLLANMPPEANEAQWQQIVTDIEQKIQRLGAINLAAIEEYQAAGQRKEYLDTQCADLTESLETLENAIKKIDRETRAKFKETFDKVNEGFMQLFPRLFGGGQASLQMTGEDLLDTGVSVMARPPGKKNSSIQLLSGGEKALTAVALVFAIFQLNPAPFCMLDEVDAPLDDSNVGRFCDLVKDMAKDVQFIFISHNKLAIEMAQQLQGVTMREPGVSRLVTVDIEEAKSMAHA